MVWSALNLPSLCSMASLSLFGWHSIWPLWPVFHCIVGIKRACVGFNSALCTYAKFTTRIIDRATQRTGRGIKGGCPGRKCFAMRTNMAAEFKLLKKNSKRATHTRTPASRDHVVTSHKRYLATNFVYLRKSCNHLAALWPPRSLITVRPSKIYLQVLWFSMKLKCVGESRVQKNTTTSLCF